MSNADEVLAKSRALLDELKFNFKPKLEQFVEVAQFHAHSLPVGIKCFHILTPPDFEWLPMIVSVYENETITSVANAVNVRHGHPVGQVCWSGSYCHDTRYRPTGEEPHYFLQAWNAKWSHFYGKATKV